MLRGRIGLLKIEEELQGRRRSGMSAYHQLELPVCFVIRLQFAFDIFTREDR